MSIKIDKYRRTYHDSKETDGVLSMLPEWMLWRNHDSLGYQFINSTFGNQAEYARSIISDNRNNLHPSVAYENEPYRIWKTYHDTASGNIPPSAYITGTLDTSVYHMLPTGTIYIDPSTIELINADNEADFFSGPPTRLTYDESNDIFPSGVSGDITGITYVKNWSKYDASGVQLIPEQDVYIVNQNIATPQSGDFMNTILYDTDWVRLDTYDYGIGYQDYDHIGRYELITDPSGYTFEYNPIVDTIRVHDYVNLDGNGNSRVMPTNTYIISSGTTDYVTTTSIVVSGINPFNHYPTQYSNYYVEYQYKKYEYPKPITTSNNLWHLQKSASPPIFVSEPAHYSGTIISHEVAQTPSGNTFALRVDPRDLRPGALADIRFDYIMAEDVIWYHTGAFDHDLSSDQYFLNTASGGAHVYYGGEDLTPYFTPRISGNSQIYIPNIVNPPHDPPYTVRMYYNAQKTYEDTIAVQSYASLMVDADPYPMDYMIERGYLIPYSILALSDSDSDIQQSLLVSRGDQYMVTTDLVFNGIAYDKDKDCYWVLESNNLCIYKIRPSDGAIIDKFNIFKVPNFYLSSYKSRVSGVIDDRNNMHLGYPFLSQDVDDGSRSATGMVYYNDYLYISSSSTGVVLTADTIGGTGVVVGGTGIYRLDTYNERVKDIEWNTDKNEVHPHYPYPDVISGVVDIALNDDEDFLLASADKIRVVGLHYDYDLIDSVDGVTRGTVYYREEYEDVVVSGFTEWRD